MLQHKYQSTVLLDILKIKYIKLCIYCIKSLYSVIDKIVESFVLKLGSKNDKLWIIYTSNIADLN